MFANSLENGMWLYQLHENVPVTCDTGHKQCLAFPCNFLMSIGEHVEFYYQCYFLFKLGLLASEQH